MGHTYSSNLVIFSRVDHMTLDKALKANILAETDYCVVYTSFSNPELKIKNLILPYSLFCRVSKQLEFLTSLPCFIAVNSHFPQKKCI